MERTEFFNDLKKGNGFTFYDKINGKDYTVFKSMNVLFSDNKEVQCKTPEEVCAVVTDSGKTIGQYIDELKEFAYEFD